ncbi:DUF202 domain-containing protein [Noviherbaspirillum cavernae]|uniref:DUF202 domain-containing protein n=1 Tax=Noviherbaspirillum cavernae TaxID=2320862 RepID=A0A418WZS9_9BURK|nr:DUF202 domain-containing protein [Noviherbaspirillum cavernae]RJG05716.1 DUF202 domain-containing protein [Noviherbaspirillum cavernae]
MSSLPDSAESAGIKPHVSEQLANERTFLAWLRTSVSLISFGITINRFSLYLIQSQEIGRQRAPLHDIELTGIGMVIAGILMIGFAALHYSAVSKSIDRGEYRVYRGPVYVTSILVMILGAVSLYWLFRR